MKLKEYNEKRNFKNTKEPRGIVQKSQKNGELKYVVQHHMASREHYDFRLEHNGVLLSWAVPKGPSLNPADKRLAVQVEDHTLEYRNFEGVIPKGEYGGGTIMLWDEGSYEPLVDIDQAIKKGSIKFELFGQRLKGKWALVRIKSKEGERQNNWLLIKDNDKYAMPDAGISHFNKSVRSKKTMEQIADAK